MSIKWLKEKGTKTSSWVSAFLCKIKWLNTQRNLHLVLWFISFGIYCSDYFLNQIKAGQWSRYEGTQISRLPRGLICLFWASNSLTLHWARPDFKDLTGARLKQGNRKVETNNGKSDSSHFFTTKDICEVIKSGAGVIEKPLNIWRWNNLFNIFQRRQKV